jgi:hypothetical protein
VIADGKGQGEGEGFDPTARPLAGADGHLQEKRNCGKGEMNFLSGILLEQ